jgi:hypothetical protein
VCAGVAAADFVNAENLAVNLHPLLPAPSNKNVIGGASFASPLFTGCYNADIRSHHLK